MVSRAKHQIHDLSARAIIDDPGQLELYGLGDLGTRVVLSLRDGHSVGFTVGDPNPSSVSYYIQPDGIDTVYTVKKSASDFWLMMLTDPTIARESRFASLDSKDVVSITAMISNPGSGFTLELRRVGDRQWQMSSPHDMGANDEQVRRLLGRVSALKARQMTDVADGQLARVMADNGLDEPRAEIILTFESRPDLHLLVGDEVTGEDAYEQTAYMMLDGQNTIYTARSGMLDDFGQDPMTLRNRRVSDLDASEVVSVDVQLIASDDDDLSGLAGVRYLAEQWVWEDGVPVPGSTPERVARRLAELQVEEFVDDAPSDWGVYGLSNPTVRATLTTRDGDTRVVLIGSKGEPEVDSEGNQQVRYYATIDGHEAVYLISDAALRVVKDMLRERNRKAGQDAQRALNRERIPSEALPVEDE